MMFRLMYRLKKKHGAVLFAVVAVMALLIAMSTAAYYTARGSYNSVVSSYNYSQLYLSAISSADMVTAAIMNEAIPSASAMNQFGKIQGAIKDDLNNIGDAIYLKSQNLNSVTINASTSPLDIIEALKYQDPMEAGVLDGLTVEIRVSNVGTFNPTDHDYSGSDSTKTVDKQTGTTPFTYVVTTTAYYRDNTITVQDVITSDKKGTRTETTYLPSGGGGGGLPSDFNPNIATGQGQPGLDGKPTDPDRVVIIDVKELNGEMAFRNEVTQIGGKVNLGNTLNGGLTSEGSLYLRYGGPKVTGKNNNWYVGKDLVLADAQSSFDLGENDLYVGGDFVIGTNGGSIKARNIYVAGDLYVLNQKTINAQNLHVAGNIYYATCDADGTPRTEAYTRPGVNINEDIGSTDDANIRVRLQGNFNLELGGYVITEGKTGNGTTINKVTANVGKYQGIASGTKTTANGEQLPSYSKDDPTKDDFTVLTAASDGSKYEKVPTSGSAADAIKANTNQDGTPQTMADKSVYPNYTAGQKAYDNEATIDFSKLDPIPNDKGQIVRYEGHFPIGTTGQMIDVTVEGDNISNAQDIDVKIPYVEDGFTLKYHSEYYSWWPVTGNVETNTLSGLSSNNVIHYNIDTDPDGKSMPIVLAANQDDGNFSWAGDSGAKGADVSVNGSGKVTFEMGNYNPDTGKYEPFKVENAGKYQIPTYVQGKTGTTSTVVGSAAQVEEIGGARGFDHLDASKAQSMTNKRSNVMIVSNKSGEAFKAAGKNGVFCGYIYAPNGTLTADNDTNGAVINLGSIVISAYEATHAEYQVELPTPNDMNDFISAMNGDTGVNWGAINGGGGGGGGGSDPPPPETTPITYNSLENWKSVGSNYVGDLVISVSSGSTAE